MCELETNVDDNAASSLGKASPFCFFGCCHQIGMSMANHDSKRLCGFQWAIYLHPRNLKGCNKL